jgi:general secretion pathway protein D
MKTVRFLVMLIMITLFSMGSIYAARMVDKNSTVSTAPAEVKQQGKSIQKETANTPEEEVLSAKDYSPSSSDTNNAEVRKGAKKTKGKTQYVTMDFDGMDISMLVKFIADITKKNFIIDNNVTGKVSVVSPRKMTIDEAYKVFESILEVNGYTTVKTGNIIKVVKSADAVTKGIETQTSISKSVQDKLVTQIIQLKYADAEDIKNLITPLISKSSSQIMSYPQSNILIVTDTVSNLKKIMEILKVIDVKGNAQDVKIIRLEHASATDLSNKLNQILSGSATDPSTRAISKRMPGATSSKEPAKILPYERTNSLIVVANAQDMKDIAALITELDIPTPSGKEDIHVYYLQNATAEDVAKVLSGMPTVTSPDAAAKAGSNVASNVAMTSTSSQQQNFKISPDKATNSLIIFADPYTYENIVETIRYLDIPRKQVYVEAFIMEVNTNYDFELGVQWSFFNSFKYDNGKKTGGWFARTGDTSVSTLGDLPAGPLLGVIGQAITINKGDTSITLPNMASFINAVSSDKDIHIISKPQIITMDNKQAEIKVGKNIPYITREDTDSTNINRTVRTYDYRDVGVTLKITPQINQEGGVRMDIFQEITTLVPGTGEEEYAPTTFKRSATTTVSVKDSETMVIGGLIGDSLTVGNAKVPLFADIPLIGYLFKTTNRSREKTNLYIFITPRVIDTIEKSDDLYRKKYGEVNSVETTLKHKSPDMTKGEEVPPLPQNPESKEQAAPAVNVKEPDIQTEQKNK